MKALMIVGAVLWILVISAYAWPNHVEAFLSYIFLRRPEDK